MKSLRRSLNNNGSTSTSPYSSPAPAPSNPLARPSEKVAPPQKVIKALKSHRSTNPQELSYTKGDFWYVTGEREGWYEALNPMRGSRGLVPKSDFEEFAKGGRNVSSGTRPGSQEPSRSNTPSFPPEPRSAPAGRTGAMSPPVMKKPEPIYAGVQYDFVAERPDELDAKKGELIIVMAQSNHEWYVAKHISRVGGPGLIPVSFVEICDPLTRQPIDLAPDEIPKVEEWKKITAEYKAAAIPLGRFDEPNAGSSAPYGNSPYAPSVSDANSQTGLLRSGSSNSVPFYRPEVDLMLPPGELTALSVPSFHNESGNYWFRLHVTHVPDEPSAPAYSLSLYRTYEDFYDFQISLLDTFPYEAGRPRSGEEDTEPPERILPYMPGPVEDAIDEDLTEYRREELDLYVKALVNLRTKDAGYIVRHELFRTFFAAKYGDYCEETLRQTAMEDLEERLQEVHVQDRAISSASQRSQSLSADPRSSLPTRSSSRASPMAQESASSRPPSSQQHYLSGGPSTGTSFGAPSPVNRHQHSASQSQTQGQPPYVKIKIYDRATDDLIALRVHPHVSHAELFEKVRARLGSEVSVLRYRTSMTQAGYKDIRDDAELRDWMRTEDQKLVLYAEQ